MPLVIGGPVVMLQTRFAVVVNLPHPLNHSQKSHFPCATLEMLGTGVDGSSGLYFRFQVTDFARRCCSFVESRSSLRTAFSAPVMLPVLFCAGCVVDCLLATGIFAYDPEMRENLSGVANSGSFFRLRSGD